jgi:ABC-2 type transport system permease protein
VTLVGLELLRLRRTRRWIPLLAIFLLAGFAGPLLARYLPDLVKSQTSENLTIIVGPARPVDGISMFASNADQLGLLVAVIVAAGVLAFDAKPGLAAFYRTRVRPVDRVVLPRFTMTSTAVSVAYVLGALAAWYETTVLIGHLDPGRLLLGIVFTVVYLWFAVAVVVLASSLARSVVAAAALAVGILLALPILGAIPDAKPWLPSTLLGAQVSMAGTGPATDFVRAMVVAIAATGVLMLVGLRRLRRREI